MLSVLHSKLNNVVNIISIQEINDTIIIQYVDEGSVTDQQKLEINSILESWPIESTKLVKLKQLDQIWNDQIQQGWTTSYGWKLGLTTSDVTLLTGAFLLCKEAATLGLSQEANIIDTNGVSHNININDLTILMIQYGQYRANLSAYYANKKQQIENASTAQELNNIII